MTKQPFGEELFEDFDTTYTTNEKGEIVGVDVTSPEGDFSREFSIPFTAMTEADEYVENVIRRRATTDLTKYFA